MLMQAQIIEEEAKDAASHVNGESQEWLKNLLKKIPLVNKRLASLGLHTMPVKEWTLTGKVSTVFVGGDISVTFGS
jgi:hypothetical protein